MAEQGSHKPRVGGSSPPAATTQSRISETVSADYLAIVTTNVTVAASASVLGQLAAGFLQVRRADDVVTVEDRARPMPGDLHSDSLGHTQVDQVSDRRAAAVVMPPSCRHRVSGPSQSLGSRLSRAPAVRGRSEGAGVSASGRQDKKNKVCRSSDRSGRDPRIGRQGWQAIEPAFIVSAPACAQLAPLSGLPHRLVNDPRQKPAAFKIVGMTTRAANTSSASSRAARAAAT